MKRCGAFTVIECVAALIVTSITLVLASWSLSALKDANQHSLDSSVDWYVFLKEMEADYHHFRLKNVAGTEVRVYSPRTGLDYVLQGRDALYLTAWNRGGYMRLFDNIQGKTCRFERLPGQRVRVEVTRTNGEKLAGIIQFYQD